MQFDQLKPREFITLLGGQWLHGRSRHARSSRSAGAHAAHRRAPARDLGRFRIDSLPEMVCPMKKRGKKRSESRGRLVVAGSQVILAFIPIRFALRHDLLGFFGVSSASTIVPFYDYLRTCVRLTGVRWREGYRALAEDWAHPATSDTRRTHQQLERDVRADGGVFGRRHLE
jgi:hypothetical protein